jgi:hypothetical protein
VVTFGGRGGVTRLAPGPGFARPVHATYGNELPPDSGLWLSTAASETDKQGPSPHAYPGYVIGGTAGSGNDGFWGTDPRAPMITRPVFLPGDEPAGMDSDTGNTRPSFWRGGIQGFNDKLTVKDRHAYWDQGRPQRQGTDFSPAGSPPNTYNNPREEPPTAELRTLNRTWSYQKGSDASRNQDDLSRPYTWVGEQGSGWSSVYGGTPGLYVPYGSRGGVPFPVVDPTNGEGGPEKVWAGPPHGLHSLTYPSGGDTLSMYGARPQMRPVRVDRPSNSPQAGQAYSQVVQQQGGPARQAMSPGEAPVHHTGRGWAGGGAWLA